MTRPAFSGKEDASWRMSATYQRRARTPRPSASGSSPRSIWNLRGAPASTRRRICRAARPAGQRRRAASPRPACIPAARPRTSSSFAMPRPRTGRLVGQQQARCRPSSSTLLLGRLPRARPGARAVRAGPLRRRRSRAPAATPASSPSMPGTRCSSATCCVRPQADELAGFKPDFTVINLPSFKADPKRHGVRTRDRHRLRLRQAARADRRHLLCRRDQEVGVHLSQLRPARQGRDAHALLGQRRPPRATSAIFFGLSGTGKTTLSADPERARCSATTSTAGRQDGIFNFEGGCYAKTIRLSREAEPEIYATTDRFGTVLENVVLDPATRVPDFDDGSLTENTRSAYPLDFIPNASGDGHGRASPRTSSC